MNSIAKKAITAQDIVNEIISRVPVLMALAINKNKIINDSIFVDFSGHVQKISVRVYETKYIRAETEPILNMDWISLRVSQSAKDPIEEAQKDLEKINHCLEFINNLK